MKDAIEYFSKLFLCNKFMSFVNKVKPDAFTAQRAS